MNAEAFVACAERLPAPSLAPGDVLVADREQCAKLIFLPPYSPDFNPIEQLYVETGAVAGAVPGEVVAPGLCRAGKPPLPGCGLSGGRDARTFALQQADAAPHAARPPAMSRPSEKE